VSIPEPEFLQSREKEDDGGTRSPKYPSTVTKVQYSISIIGAFSHFRDIFWEGGQKKNEYYLCLIGIGEAWR
jgi:hypothetical protein